MPFFFFYIKEPLNFYLLLHNRKQRILLRTLPSFMHRETGTRLVLYFVIIYSNETGKTFWLLNRKRKMMELKENQIKKILEKDRYTVVTYTDACGNIVNTIMTSEHTSLEKIYLSHFIRNGCKRVMCERWVGD